MHKLWKTEVHNIFIFIRQKRQHSMKRKWNNNCENETQKKHVMTMTLHTSSNELKKTVTTWYYNEQRFSLSNCISFVFEQCANIVVAIRMKFSKNLAVRISIWWLTGKKWKKFMQSLTTFAEPVWNSFMSERVTVNSRERLSRTSIGQAYIHIITRVDIYSDDFFRRKSSNFTEHCIKSSIIPALTLIKRDSSTFSWYVFLCCAA